MGRRQKSKSKKRPKSWHRGRSEARRWKRTDRRLPDLGTDADPTTGAPLPLRRTPRGKNKGDAL